MQVPVTFDSANRKKDRSVSMRFTTNLEVSNADFAEMDKVVGSQGWLLFKDNEFSVGDVPDEPAPSREGKTKIQRMRSVYFLLWKKTDQSEPFDSFWDRQFERVLDKLKERLD